MHWIVMPYVDNVERTAQALMDCQVQTLPDVRILLIDNGSGPDGYAFGQQVQNARTWVWHHHPPLPSLAGTWNVALHVVWTAGGDHALVLNNDVQLPGQLYEALLTAQQVTGALLVSAANVGEAWDHVRDRPILPWDGAFLQARGGPDFSCFLITRECHERFPFDPGFEPAYCEDIDLHRRMLLAGEGQRIFALPVPYYHYGSGTLKGLDAERRTHLERRIDTARTYYQEKWGGPPNAETWYSPFGAQEPLDTPMDYPGPTTPELQRALGYLSV